MPIAQLRREHAQTLDATVTLAQRQLAGIWRSLDTADAARTQAILTEAVPELAAQWGDIAAVSGSDFYDAIREFYNPSGPRYAATPGGELNSDQIEATTRWALSPIWSLDPDVLKALERLNSGLERAIRGADRETIGQNAASDRGSRGWRRVARPDACAFCVMLTTRWGDYTSREAAQFVGHAASGRIRGTQGPGDQYHDHCNCWAEPVFDGWTPDAQEQHWAEMYAEAYSKAGDTKGALARMRESLGSN